MANPSAAAKLEGPGEPHFKLPKNAVAPFDMAALVDVDRVYANPGDISLEVNAKLVQRLTYARFTAEGVAAADAGKVAHLMRVLQMLFDASESDNDHYAEQLNLCQEEMAALRLAKQEDEQLRQVNADLEMRLRHRADRIAELEAEAAAKQAAKQEADSLRQRLFQLQGETEKLRITSEEYRKTAEGKLQRAADFESKSRKGTRETDRDVRALRAVVQQSQEEVDQLGRTCQQHQANEVSLRQELHVLAAKEKTLMAMLDEAKAEAEQLKIRLEERDDQCLSLEKHAVEDLKTFRGKAAQLQSEKDRLIERLQRDAQQQQESVALFKQEVHDARRLLSEAQQQTEDMAEKAALKEKECRQLRAVVERERSSRLHDSHQTGFAQASPQPGGGGGGGGPHRDEEYLHVSEVLRVARRDLLVEQEKVREGDEERARMDRDLAELRKQLEVYESCGPGAAVQDMRGALASMREKVVEREEAVGELRDRLNQADEDLDTVLQFAESLKQLALSLGVSQEEILQLANKVDTAQRKASELEELEEKVRIRDKEIELLERERLHWKKQVRLQALPRLEQAQRMGLTPEQLATLSEITDRMRGSGLSDVQALVGMHTGEDDALFSQTRHAELERKLETAREKNEALTEMHQRLRTLFMDVCKERDERRLLTNLAAPAGEEDYMRQLIAQAVAGGSASAADPEQLQAMVAQLAAAAQGAAAAAAAAAAQQQQQPPAASTEASSESPKAKEKVSLVQQVAQGTSPFVFGLPQGFGAAAAAAGGGAGGDERLAKLAQDYKENADLLQELKRELQRTNDALENAERRSTVYMEERDAFRRTLALQVGRGGGGAAATATPAPPPSFSGEGGGDAASAAGAHEVWDTQASAAPPLAAGVEAAEVATELQRALAQREEAVRTLLEQNEAKSAAVAAAEAAAEEAARRAGAAERAVSMRADEAAQQAAAAAMLRESLADAELLLREERARLEEHQEFIAGLQGGRDGEAVRLQATEALRKVTTMRVNELRLVHRYRMCKAEADGARQRLQALEQQHEATQRSLTEELVLAKGQLKEAEGIQRVLHARLEFVERTRASDALRGALAAASQQVQELLAVDRGLLEEAGEVARLRGEAAHQKQQVEIYKSESERWREAAGRASEAAKGAAAAEAPLDAVDAATAQRRLIDLDVEVKECRSKAEAARRRAEAALGDANASEEVAQEVRRELLRARKEKAEVLGRVRELEELRGGSVPLKEARGLQARVDALEREKAGLEAKLMRATEVAQAAVENDLTVSQVQRSYQEELAMLRRVVEGMEPSSEEGYILGEMQYRGLQQTVENIRLKKEKDRADLVVTARRQQAQALQLQNTQLLADLSRVYNEYITRSHELHQENGALRADCEGRLTAEESRRVNERLAARDEEARGRESALRAAELRARQHEELQRDAESLRATLLLLDEKDMGKAEAELKKRTVELSAVKLSAMQGEWEADKTREEAAMLRRVKSSAEERINELQRLTVELQGERDSANSEFSRKIEEVYSEMKRNKAREATLAAAAAEPPVVKTAAGRSASGAGGGASPSAAEEHCEELSRTVKELRGAEARAARTASELRAANTELRATVGDLQAEAARRERVADALQKEVLDERLRARQEVERVRAAEAARGEAMGEVARLNAATMGELLKKKDAALVRLTDQLQGERQKLAAEKQIDNARVARLHKQLHNENGEQLKKFAERLEEITLAPPVGAEGDGSSGSGSGSGTFADVRAAQLVAEISRLQAKLHLADAEVASLRKERTEKLATEAESAAAAAAAAAAARAAAGAAGSPQHGGASAAGASAGALPSEAAAKMQGELERLGAELRKERLRGDEEHALRLQKEEDLKRHEGLRRTREGGGGGGGGAGGAGSPETKEVEVSTDDAVASAAAQSQSPQRRGGGGADGAVNSAPLESGDRVIVRRRMFFKSGRSLEIGDFGVVGRVVGGTASSSSLPAAAAKGEDRTVEVTFDRDSVVFDCREGVDVERAPNPAFTVYADTPLSAVNAIILQRETLIRKQALQLDALEREAAARSRELTRLSEAEAAAVRGRRDAEATARELERAAGGSSAAAAAAQEADAERARAEGLERKLREARREERLRGAEAEDLRDAARSLKRELTASDQKLLVERRKMDQELAERFDEAQACSSDNVRSLRGRLSAMEDDLQKVRDRELMLRKETMELEDSLCTEKTARELAQQAVKEAWAKVGGGPGGSHASVGPDGAMEFEGTGGGGGGDGGGGGETRRLRRRVSELEGLVERLEARNTILRDVGSGGGGGGVDSSSSPLRGGAATAKRVDELLREKAEWSAIQTAMLRHLRGAQDETVAKEAAIKRRLDACRQATEQRVRSVQHEADVLVRGMRARLASLETKLTEAEQYAYKEVRKRTYSGTHVTHPPPLLSHRKCQDDAQLAQDLGEAQQTAAKAKAEVVKSEGLIRGLRQVCKNKNGGHHTNFQPTTTTTATHRNSLTPSPRRSNAATVPAKRARTRPLPAGLRNATSASPATSAATPPPAPQTAAAAAAAAAPTPAAPAAAVPAPAAAPAARRRRPDTRLRRARRARRSSTGRRTSGCASRWRR